MENIENTLKKMGLVIEKLAQKVDELDKRVKALEDKKSFSSNDFKTSNVAPSVNNTSSSSSSGGFLSSLFGSAVGAFAGMSLFNALFNNDVKAEEMAKDMGVDESDLSEIESKLDEIDNKLDEVDNRLDEVANDDYFEDYEGDLADNDFDSGFDDFDV